MKSFCWRAVAASVVRIISVIACLPRRNDILSIESAFSTNEINLIVLIK
jgi:hypothetical protein